jgi:tetratricopeptide (TPR) repeat protein
MPAWLAVGLLVLAPAGAHAGYEHYWTWQERPDPGALRAAVAEMRRLAEARPDLVRFEATDRSISVNGIGDGEHEPFEFPGSAGWSATKTNWKPYDQVVTACLLAARDHFPPAVLFIESDGQYADWAAGRALYSQVLGRTPRALGGVGFFATVTRWLGGWAEYFYPLGLGCFFLLLMTRRSGGFGASCLPYYLFWLAAPTVISLLTAHPAVLLAVPVAWLARRRLPDPFLAIKHAGQARRLEAELRVNPNDVTARRNLAMIWLERSRPARALPLIEQALGREPDSLELQYLRGVALLAAGRHGEAVEILQAVMRREPRFRQDEVSLRLADGLMALRQWQDAEHQLAAYVDTLNQSSVEGWYKLWMVRRAQGNAAGAREALRSAAGAYRGSPAFHRRRQLGWYLRARARSIA